MFGATTIPLYTRRTFDWRRVTRDWQRSDMNSQQFSLGEDGAKVASECSSL